MRRIALIAAGILVAFAAGCGGDGPRAAQEPDAIRLATPRQAVGSYLAWLSYAYRVGDVAPAAPTMSAAERARVEAYIARNRARDRGIEQELLSFRVRSLTAAEETATLAARESWEYRYLSFEPLEYTSELSQASYETTYTLVRTAEGWVVDDIEVAQTGGAQ